MKVIEPLLGGVLIGLSAFLMQFLLGRIAGISGIVGRLLPATPGDIAWRLAFVLGLIGGGTLMLFVNADGFSAPIGSPSNLRIILAGLLVGFGTRLGSGCTSGHGVCGVSRLSPRSIVATLSFIGMGAVTVTLARTWSGF